MFMEFSSPDLVYHIPSYNDPFSDGSAIFGLFFIIVIGLILFSIIRGIAEWHTNNESPILTVVATIITKRMNVDHHNHHDANGHHMNSSSSTTYYVTFEVESGSRIELVVHGREYGLLAEKDYGKLTFQGTRYLGFERMTNPDI